MEEKLKKKIIIGMWVFTFLIIGGIVIFLQINDDSVDVLKSCKLGAWEGCGMVVTEDMCWRLANGETNDTVKEEFLHCQNITMEQRLCWVYEGQKCYDEYYNVTVEKIEVNFTSG